MSDNENIEINPDVTLPDELNSFLSPTWGRVLDHLYLSGAADGTMEGETHLIIYKYRLLAFSRATKDGQFDPVPLDDTALPRLEEADGRMVLVLTSREGREMNLPLSLDEEMVARRVVVQFEEIFAEEELDSPTETYEDGILPGDSRGEEQVHVEPEPEDQPSLMVEVDMGDDEEKDKGGALAEVVVTPEAVATEPEEQGTDSLPEADWAKAEVVNPAPYFMNTPEEAEPRDADGYGTGQMPIKPTATVMGVQAIMLPPAEEEDEQAEAAAPDPEDAGTDIDIPMEIEEPREAEDDDYDIPDHLLRTVDLAPMEPEDAPTEAEFQAVVAMPAPREPKPRQKTIFSGADLHDRYHKHIHEDGDLDAAFCVADALVFMGKAKKGVTLFHEHHKPQSLQRTERVISDEAWRNYVQSPHEDSQIGELLAVMAPALTRATARKTKAFDLLEEDKRDLATDLLQISRVVGYASHALGVSPVDLYVQQERPQGFLFANTVKTLSFVAGADLLKGRHQNELTFIAARQLALVRPSYFLVNLLPGAGALRQAVLAAIKLSVPKLPIPKAELAGCEQLTKTLKKHLASRERKQLKAHVSRLVKGGSVDLDSWYFELQLTADRAALLLCQDLFSAANIVEESPQVAGMPSAARRVQELVKFCLSEEYATIRRSLGLVINAGA